MKIVKRHHGNLIGLATALILAVSVPGLSGCDRLRNYTDQEYLQRAKQSQSQGKLEAAVIDFKNALQKNPKNAEARWLLGQIYADQGLGSEAEKELKLAQDLGISREAVVAPLGKALLAQGFYKRVMEEVQPTRQTSQGTSAKILEIRGRAQLGLRKLDEACALFTQSLERDPRYVRAYWGLSYCAQARGNPAAAKAELEKALKLEDKNSGTWALLGDVERAAQRLPQAEAAYTSALQHETGNLNALFGRAVVRIHGNRLKEAGQDLDASAKIVKDHPVATHLRGVIQFKNRNYTDAKISFETALKSLPEYMPATLWLGFTNYSLKSYEQAVQQFTQYIRAYPSAVQIQAMLALAQAKLGIKQQAQETLKLLDAVNIEDPQSLITLGQAHLFIGESERATDYLQQAVSRQPDAAEPRMNLAVALTEQGEYVQAIEQAQKAMQLDSSIPRGDEFIIQTFIKDKKFDQALQAIEALKAKRPKDPLPYEYQGSVLYMQQDRAGARSAFAKAIALQPGHPQASHNLAVLAVEDGKLDEARGIYRNVLKHNKDHLPALLALYAIEIKAKQLQQAGLLLEEIVAKHPKEPGPARLLAFNHVASGNALKALEVSQEAARAHPDDIELLQVRGGAYAASGDTGNALASYTRIVQLLPGSAEAHFKLAALHNALQDRPAARKALDETLKRDDKHLGAKLMLAQLNLAEGHLDTAQRLAREARQQHPEAVEAAITEADILNRQAQPAEAARLLEALHQAHPESEQAVIALARLHWARGNQEGSLKLVTDWRNNHPNNPGPSLYLGLAYLSLGREAEAMEAFEQMLKLTPADVGALNNLAILSSKTQPQRALEYAEKAYRLQPKNPLIADTLGWLLVGQGETARGLELLRAAFSQSPNNPELHYHYAAALAKSGAKEQARRELRRLLDSGEKFPGHAEAEALFAQL